MKQRVYSVLQLVRLLDKDNAYEVLTVLSQMHNIEGKNPIMVAIDNKLYDKAAIMLSPVKVPDKDEYKIFFNPFVNGVVAGNTSLKWPKNDERLQFKEDYEGVLNTRTEFYGYYSTYAYIECIKDEEARNRLEQLATYVPYEFFDKIPMSNLPAYQFNKDTKIYEEKDIVKHYPLPLVKFVTDMFNKGIDVATTLGERTATIEININELSGDNRIKVAELLKDNRLTIQNDKVVIMIEFNPDFVVSEIVDYLDEISNEFFHQMPKYEAVCIPDYYDALRDTLSASGIIELPENPSLNDQIAYCMKYNKNLSISNHGLYFYMHPSVNDRKDNLERKVKIHF